MKHHLLCLVTALAISALALNALATNALSAAEVTYPYLILTTSSGTQVALAVESLEMTFADGKLVARNASGEATFSLADLASMQFSETNSGTQDAVQAPATDTSAAEGIALYDLSGRHITSRQPAPGIYLVRKSNGETVKVKRQ